MVYTVYTMTSHLGYPLFSNIKILYMLDCVHCVHNDLPPGEEEADGEVTSLVQQRDLFQLHQLHLGMELNMFILIMIFFYIHKYVQNYSIFVKVK